MRYVLSVSHEQLLALVEILTGLRDQADDAVVADVLALLEKAKEEG